MGVPSALSSFITMVVIGLLAVAWNFLYPATSAPTIVAQTCKQLRGDLGATLITLPSDPQYEELSEVNWSQTAWKEPSCIARPGCASDVQRLVRVLTANRVPFAIRSGGHSVNPFDANIDSPGVLIALDRLNQTTYDAGRGVAAIGPGARWGAVYAALDRYNVTVVGGRVLDVGVGGLMLGSGLSYLSDLYGMACDNVVVLADGSVVEASAGEHPDLFWALKGGANNFGIVTQFRTTTFPINQVWGGVQVYTLEQMPDVLRAYEKYHTAPNKDLYANMVMNLSPTNDTVLVTLVYLKPEERPAAFAAFYELTPTLEQTGVMSLTQLMGAFPAVELPRWTWYTSSFRVNGEVLGRISELLGVAPEVAAVRGLPGGTLVVTVQPISENLVLAGRDRGGNALGLRAVNQTWIALNVAWWDEADDAAAYAAVESLHMRLEALIREQDLALDYIFMNDANIKQPVIASYGQENAERLRAVQRVYDPHLVFRKLVRGGQKLPA
ncbi:hypothetical protein DL768_005477 [Monosporascus sp. mg162]|nr:hypothetical protein DL768_005477 [Monosporascus sp. mg162]